jgi:hypothetical protein
MAIIPGQSLTAEPKNAPYENAPQMTNPEDAIVWHVQRLMETEKTEALLDALELGLDVVTLTEGILRGAVLDGRHSIDVSLIIAPVIHEFIKTSADATGIEYEEGFPDDSKEKSKVKYQINQKKASKILDELKGQNKLRDLPSGEPEVEMPPEEMEITDAQAGMPTGNGLMSRPSKEGMI